MYAGNVGFSQSLEMVVAAARAIPEATFVINGHGAARPQLEADAAGLANVRFGDHQPAGRLNEVLATGDVHVVPLRRGLGRVSVPSKTYSILAAGRPVVAAIDADSEVSRIVAATGCGVVVAPDDTDAFIEAIRAVLGTVDRGAGMGRAGRAWVERSASPGATAAAYEDLVRQLSDRAGGRLTSTGARANASARPAGSLAPSWHPHRRRPKRPPSSPRRARARRSGSRAGPCSR